MEFYTNMPKLFLKQFIIVAIIILAVLSIVFGSYLPLVKSRRFISALRSVSSIRTIDQFKGNFDQAFKFYSPVGDEEIAKFLSSNILQIISQENQSEAVSRVLVAYIEPYLFQDNVRHLIVAGQMYEILWGKYGREEDFQKAENYFQKAFTIGPKLPPVLYGMLNFYQMKGDTPKVKEISEIILQYWPDDETVKKIIQI